MELLTEAPCKARISYLSSIYSTVQGVEYKRMEVPFSLNPMEIDSCQITPLKSALIVTKLLE